MDSENVAIEALEIDLDIAECGEILAAHGITPTTELVESLWHWKEQARGTGPCAHQP